MVRGSTGVTLYHSITNVLTVPSQRTVMNRIPNISNAAQPPFDYIVCTTKNCPDIKPTLPTIISSAVTPGHSIIVLIQNGLNIEKPFFEAFPENIVLSGVSMIDSHEAEPGHIIHEEPDILYVGPFHNPNLELDLEKMASEAFIKIYAAAGKTQCRPCEDVPLARWRKLVFNACLNPICAITGLDDARVRLVEGAVEGLLRPVMTEIVAIAKALGHVLPEDVIDTMINLDPMDLYLKPSMQCDIEKVKSLIEIAAQPLTNGQGNYIEFENIVGEPLKEAHRVGVPTPILRTIYELCKMLQFRLKERNGLVTVPPKRIL
jgi:2-dehydropantoate 2-reductase